MCHCDIPFQPDAVRLPDSSASNGIGEMFVEGQIGLLEIQNYHTYCLQTRLCNNAVLEYSQTFRIY